MRFKAFMIGIIMFFLVEITILFCFNNMDNDSLQNSVEVNEAVQSVREDWNRIESHQNSTSLDYTVLDMNGTLIFATRQGLSESINAAVIHRDTILEIDREGILLGKIIIYNDTLRTFPKDRRETAAVLIFAAFIQCAGLVIYLIYLNKRIVKPFKKMRNFAERVAGGNLDIPLEMDRGNIFGAFTESFDIMRAELKKARLAEARANAEKKELVVKLSHDIRTPVASIKAASEVGEAIAENEKERQNYIHIIHKADQINALVTNLFSATLEELSKLSVEPCDMKSEELHNIFANSYKYANTKIDIEIEIKISEDEKCLAVTLADYGGGVKEEELPLIKEKFKRGKNSENIEGAGLGLYIADSFMREMQGGLVLRNGNYGLEVTVIISLSGTVIR